MFRNCLIGIALAAALLGENSAADWPMWRHDPGRTAASPQKLPENPGLSWVRRMAPLGPAYRDNRLQFDAGYEPIVLGKRLFVASNRDDSVTAIDTETGEQLWKFFTNGPVRFAPVGGKGRIIFGSDDGCVYCVKASDGSLVWKKRAVPSHRRVLGNDRLISVWPIRGGPVLKEDRVYFAAGVWPLEGTFVFCVDAATGETIWRNDRAAYLYQTHPHNAEAYGGLAPQGYLVIDGEDLIVPSSQAYPAKFDLITGELKEFELPAPGRLPGGWFASTPSEQEAQKLKRRGVLFDKAVNYRVHEDKPHFKGDEGVRERITAGGRDWNFADGIPGVKDPIHTMVAADGKLFVVTKKGDLSCFAENPGVIIRHPTVKIADLPIPEPGIFSELDLKHGHAVVLGTGEDTGILESLLHETDLRIIAIDDRPDRVRSLRQQGWINAEYGDRLTILEDDPAWPGLPPYFASLIVVDESVDLNKAKKIQPETSVDLSLGLNDVGSARLRALCDSLRPYGGKLIARQELELPTKPNLSTLFQSNFRVPIPPSETDPEFRLTEHESGWTIFSREGALPGSTNYTGDWAESADELVTGPLGILWFDDSISHFKRSPQPKFIDGVMISSPKDWTDASTRQGKVDYRLLPPVFSDVYTGRILADEEAPELRQSFGEGVDLKTVQPSQYRPPRQKDDWKPEAPRAGERINPITLEKEPRVFPKSYGCDGGVDYGNVYSMRSGTPAFYDKRIESGTVNISGPRSGCTNSVIPANGLLNLPYFYDGCTCSYPLPMAAALVAMPESFEQWASWGEVPAEKLSGKIQRIGINFGAPGDRMTREGTLWLDLPNVGGPSPAIEVTTEPPLETLESWYRHSLFMKGGDGWPWVAGSGFRGVRSVTIGGIMPGRYTVRMTLATEEFRGSPDFPVHPEDKKPGIENGVRSVMNSHLDERKFVRVPDDGILKIDLSEDEPGVNLSGIEIVPDDRLKIIEEGAPPK